MIATVRTGRGAAQGRLVARLPGGRAVVDIGGKLVAGRLIEGKQGTKGAT